MSGCKVVILVCTWLNHHCLIQSPDFFCKAISVSNSKQINFVNYSQNLSRKQEIVCNLNDKVFAYSNKMLKTVRTTSAAGDCNFYKELSVAGTVK